MVLRRCVVPALNCHIQLMLLFINIYLVTYVNRRAVLYQTATCPKGNQIAYFQEGAAIKIMEIIDT